MLFYPNFTFANINIELRHNVPTSQRSSIEQERGRNLTLGQSTFCRPGGVPIKNFEIAIFLHFHVYIYIYILEDFPDFVWCFLCENVTKPYHCVRIAQKVSQQSVPSIINKRHAILTKRLSVAIAIIRAFLYRGIPSDVQSRYEQPLNLPVNLLPRWQQAVCKVSNGRCQNELYRKGSFVNYLWLYSGPRRCYSILILPSLI